MMHVLDPEDSLGEILFGLIMVLTFTLGAGVAAGQSGAEEARTLIYGAIGCNVAWGLIDGAFFIMGAVFTRGRRSRIRQAFREAKSRGDAISVVRNELDEELEPIVGKKARDQLYEEVYEHLVDADTPPGGIRLSDVKGAAVAFLLVALTAIPAAIPFFFIDDPQQALRFSNVLLLGLMFVVGFRWAKYTHANPWVAGFGVTAIGIILVVVAIALGG